MHPSCGPVHKPGINFSFASPGQEADRALDAQVASLTAVLKAMGDAPGNKPHMFVTDNDIRSLPVFQASKKGQGGRHRGQAG